MQGRTNALQFIVVVSELDGVEDIVDLVLRDTDVSLGNLDARMVQNLVEQDKAFCATVVCFINVASECLTECMGGEVVNVEFVLPLELLELLVDTLDSERPSSVRTLEDVVVLFWRVH